MTPSNNTTAATTGVAGAATMTLVWVLGLLGVDMPPEIAAAAVLVVGSLVGLLVTPRNKGDHAA